MKNRPKIMEMAANLNVDRLDFSSPKPFHVTENVDSFRKLL